MSSDTILLSIIVPVYNVEKYLGECLDSIFDPSADENEYEVIAVDDGSTDGSTQILKGYGRHKNFRLITQGNSGLGAARNAGIKAAKGRYISFIDSDDYFLPGAVSALLGFARESDCDIIEFETESSNETARALSAVAPRTDRVLTSGTGKKLFPEWQRQGAYLPSAWLRIYRKEFIYDNSLFFLPIIYEDAEWQPRCFFHAAKVVYHPVTLYHYRRREGSITLSDKGREQCWNFINLVKPLSAFMRTIGADGENTDFLCGVGDIAARHLDTAINLYYKSRLAAEDKKMIFSEMAKHRGVLAFAASEKGRKLYKITRWLPDRAAFRLYKII